MRHKNTFSDFISSPPRHKTAAIPGTMAHVPNFPRKLKIYLNNASPYWQATYFDNGTTYRHSCKTRDKMEALKRAGIFYEMLILRKYQHPEHINSRQHHGMTAKPRTLLSSLAFKQITSEWLARKATRWSPRHMLEVERRLKNNLYPFIGTKNIQRISAQEILALLQKVEARGAYNLAHRILGDCSQIWRFAIACGLCKRDVTEGLLLVLHPCSVKHQNAVKVEHLPELMRKIAHDDKPGGEATRDALLMIAMTFVRKGELLYARWEEFDLEKAIWKIPAERMKMRIEHVVPLSRQVLSLLNNIRQHHSSGYIFHHGNPENPLPTNALLDTLYRMGYKGKMTAHGFRAVASTILNEQGFRPDVIERQLAHTEPNQIRRAYNHAQYLPERTEMMQWWGDYLEKITGEIPQDKTANSTTFNSPQYSM